MGLDRRGSGILPWQAANQCWKEPHD